MHAIAGGKGGCGKTTVACGVAAALGRAGHRPLVVDLDVDMPDLPERVGATPEPGLDELAAGRPLGAVAQTDHDLPGAGVVASGGATAIQPALARLGSLDRPVLLDCPAGAGPDAARGLAAAATTLVVSTPTRESLEDAVKTAAMSRTLGTPVRTLALRETHHGRVPPRSDERLRELVAAPTLLRIPAFEGDCPSGNESPPAVPSPGTPAADRFASIARRIRPSFETAEVNEPAAHVYQS